MPPNLSISADKTELKIPVTAAGDASAVAGIATVEGTAQVGSTTQTRTALAPTAINLAPRSPDENQLPAFLLASTMKPRFKGQPVDQDTGRKVHRGTTFPGEVIVLCVR